MEAIRRLTTFLRRVMTALAPAKTESCTILNRWNPRIKIQGLQCYSGSVMHLERKSLRKHEGNHNDNGKESDVKLNKI